MLIIDQFAGGGGASMGITLALGRAPDVAINHDAAAIAMHTANHPGTRHYCEDVWDVDPLQVTGGQPVGLMWMSPDCKHFSKAKGGKPVEKRIRALAWVALRWVVKVRPLVIILENVEEFTTWGPIVDGKPCPRRKGQHFLAFTHALERKGYRVEWRELRACDYGTPTSRKRLFLIARCDGLPIAWPAPTHGPGRLPYRTAAECIDWSIPCPSIFRRARPLQDATCRRIARGIMRYVVQAAEPFIIPVTHHGDLRAYPVSEPLRTVTSANGGVVGQSMTLPLGTVTAVDHHSLQVAHLTKLRGTSTAQAADEPLHTVSAQGQHFAAVRAFLIRYYSQGGQDASLFDPMHTVTTHDRLGLVTIAGEQYAIADIGFRMLQPRELFLAQGFPADYIIGDDGRAGLRLTKAEQVRMCGNSVCPPIAAALVAANCGELAMKEAA